MAETLLHALAFPPPNSIGTHMISSVLSHEAPVSLNMWKAANPSHKHKSLSLPAQTQLVCLDQHRAEKVAVRQAEDLLTAETFVPVVDLIRILKEVQTKEKRELIVRLIFRNHGGLIIDSDRVWNDMEAEFEDAILLFGLNPVWLRCCQRVSHMYFH